MNRLRPAGRPGTTDTNRLHAMAPGLVGQTIEQAAGHPRMRHVCGGAKAKPAIWAYHDAGFPRRRIGVMDRLIGLPDE